MNRVIAGTLSVPDNAILVDADLIHAGLRNAD
ncbi:hypothetical protein Thi970DRAFT_01526 [Thiorhodovibrio frisius]|uniref:Uncharacterized protein n=1 Tax=Thiorhodovibrio frisius TaxID=631362 RepID=H8Z0U0_9GAMM|nr:hypothetical protein Thi970DRAFT_01526 [Thiorhodovibrio frisius]WPL23905.1 hypothetical protein Thiofri_04114 [Thiorhodovibrio frisius]